LSKFENFFLFSEKKNFLHTNSFYHSLRIIFIRWLALNPCGKSDQLIVYLNVAKNGWAKRSKKREALLRVKISLILIFDAKLRFAHFASLRSAILSNIQVNNWFVTFPERLNHSANQVGSRFQSISKTFLTSIITIVVDFFTISNTDLRFHPP